MSVIDFAKSHYRKQLDGEMIVIDVPEWVDENGNPTRIFIQPVSLKEKNAIFKYQADNSLEALAETMIVRCRTEDGKLMFAKADKVHLMRSVDPDVISRIVFEINTKSPEHSVEDAKKN
jgi:hypothetical protein